MLKQIRCQAVVGASVALSFFSFPQLAIAEPVVSKEVVITASRYERSLKDVQADVTVIDQDDIKRSGASNLTDLLKRSPGVQYSSNGGGQQASSLFIRGADSKHTLFLVDGQRIGPLDGFSQFQFQHVPLDQIERIEILRGPGSSLYGSDAIGGVVQIITKKAARKSGGDVAFSLGNNHTRKLSTSGTFAGERGSIRLGVGHEYSDGINASRDNSGKDAYRITSGSFNGLYELTKHTQLTASALATDVNNEFDSNPQFNRDNQTVLNVGLKHQWTDGAESSIRLGSSTEELEFPLFDFGTRTFQNQFSLDHRFSVFNGVLLLGYEYLDQRFSSTSAPQAGIPNVDNTQVNSGLVTYTKDVAGYTIQGNLRFDANSNYRDVATGQVSVSRALNEQVKLGTLIGTGFKRPNFSQISGFANPFAPGFVLNPAVVNTNLDPEESENYELYAAISNEYGQSRISVFQNLVQDLIVGNLISPGNTRFTNEPGVAKIEGISFSHEGGSGPIVWGASLDILSAKNARDERLLRRAIQTAKVYGSYNLPQGWSIGAEFLANGKRDDIAFPGGRVQLGGYSIINTTVQYELDKQNSFTFRVDNLTGKDYEIVKGFGVAQQDVLLTYNHKF
ncbi:vitamin B12 transporter [Limnobacter thiooxidans]|uniref:TonB-dependent receptor n=1 Tax=Limnobacter thiooxidans TaxID=131080 RepID=A0AA86MEM0_9BURK|nr:vitamin B12 transporter [Limnobacter thiooxidans]BET27176.1 TonB-dependent receptor [Limnobacter thiooxidans]